MGEMKVVAAADSWLFLFLQSSPSNLTYSQPLNHSLSSAAAAAAAAASITIRPYSWLERRDQHRSKMLRV
jgi:hypothetical protein